MGVSAQSVALSVLAVEGTTLSDWTRPDSPLRLHLIVRLQEMKRLNLSPALVLWQQGEADAMLGTDPAAYREQLAVLRQVLTDHARRADAAGALHRVPVGRERRTARRHGQRRGQ